MKSTEQGKFNQLLSFHAKQVVHWPPNWRVLRRCVVVLLFVAFLSGLAGCQRINLPRIDPTGNRIFLPCPNTTQLTLPHLHERNGEPGLLPTPAFVEPVAPPACIDGSCEDEGGVCNLFKHKLVGHIQDKLDHHNPGKCGEIQLTPMRVVAPVGGEVVLLAGICGEDGYLVRREPIEWMLSPDSVGTFIEVGDDNTSKLINTLRHNPKIEKLDVDFARGRTSNRETLITRGTKSCDDDIKLKQGQTWLSISSPSEGVSRVTALAPDSEIWDRRRQTATIYWVDAQWEFPQPQIARSGEGITLLTRVTKAENLKPATGWTVLYTIVDPSIATFVPPADAGSGRVQISGNSAKVRVDENGQALVQVTAPPGGRGTTPVVIEVIRPAEPSDNLPELLLGRGQTVVTFSSPGMSLQTFGPESGSVGEQLTYSVILANPGDIDAENVRLLFQIPAGMKFIGASLRPTSQAGDTLVWEQGVLAAQRQLESTVILEAQQQGDFVVRVRSEGQPKLADEKSISTRVIAPSVTVRFEPVGGIAQAEIGSVINFDIDVTNTGRQALTDLKLLIESDQGMPHLESLDNRIEQTIAMLQPGQTTRLGVAFKLQQEGQFGARLKVLSGNALLAETPAAFVRAVPPKEKQPAVAVSVEFPDSIPVGRRANALITVKNTGETTLTGLRVAIASDPALRPVSVDSGNISRVKKDGAQLIWTPQDLMRGTLGDAVIQMLVEFEAVSPIEQASISAQAATAENVQDQAQVITRIISNNVLPPAAGGTTNPNQPRTGDLQLSISDFGDPRAVNQVFRYSITVTNAQNVGDRNIRVQLRVPEGLALEGVSTLTGEQVAFQRDNDIFTLQPVIQFMRPGETLTYLAVVRGLVPSQVVMNVRVTSDGQPNGKTAAESTTIVPAAQ